MLTSPWVPPSTSAYTAPGNLASAGDAAALLGSITGYPLTADFSDTWSKPPARRDYQQGRRPSYSSLSTGQPVRLFGERELGRTELAAGTRMLLLTSQPFDYRLAIAVAAYGAAAASGPRRACLSAWSRNRCSMAASHAA